jgi:hypothetical protein
MFSTISHADILTLAWDPPSQDSNLTFSLCYGTTSNIYTTCVDTGTETTVTLENIEPGITYYFAAKASNQYGESEFSQEIEHVIPVSPAFTDDDNDSFTENQGDCNDADATIYPGAEELCGDGIDQDCNGSDRLCPNDVDNDSDGFTENQGDCNDTDTTIHPDAEDICGDGIDQNCDGNDVLCPADIDDDNDGFTENQGDCNDADATIYPGAEELCGDGVDQDCDGSDTPCPNDIDDDGDGFTENQGDCNDTDSSIHPGAEDVCGDRIDQDCDGSDSACESIVSDAGPDRMVIEGDLVTLNGSNSNDLNGGIASYSWAQLSGPVVILSGADTPALTFTAPVFDPNDDVLEFSLTVGNSDGFTDTDTCTVTVTQQIQPPVADAGPDQKVSLSSEVKLNGSNSTNSAEDDLSYSWKQISGETVRLSDSLSPSPTFQSSGNEQALVFELTVTDSEGLSDTDSCIVNISEQNEPPTSLAGSDIKVTSDQIVHLNGTGSMDDNEIISYSWLQTEGPTVNISDPNSATPEFIPPPVSPKGASLTFQLTVTDQGGLKDTDSCIVNVTSQNQPPVAVTNEYVETTPDTTITLDGTLSVDLDDGIEKYRWHQLEGPPVTFDNPESAETNFTAPDSESYGSNMLFELKVEDKSGLKNSAKCAVFVQTENDETLPFTVTPTINLFQKRSFSLAKVYVTVVDEKGKAVKGAKVKGYWILPGANPGDEVIGTTNAKGEVKLDSGRFKDKGELSFTVTEISTDVGTYSVNIETNIIVP